VDHVGRLAPGHATGTATDPPPPADAPTAYRPGLRPWLVDGLVGLLYTAVAFWLTAGLWPDPTTRAIADNVNDQALIEWFLAHGTLVWTGDFSFVTDRLNAPLGVNLMNNASHITHGVLMAPVTLLFGAPVSFALLLAGNLAATALGWYLLFARTLGLRRGAALVGGLVTGFAPGMMAQSNSHLHMTAQWLVPPIVWCLIRLTRVETTRQTVLTAVGLAALVVAQAFLGEEVLFLAALTVLIFGIAYALRRRDWARRVGPRFLAGGLLVAGLAGAVLAYPLWIQFAGPLHTPNGPFDVSYYYADVASYGLFSPLSVAGTESAGELATSPSEYNTYLGLPLVGVTLACLVWLRRRPATTAIAVTALVMTLLSFGPHVTFAGERTGLPSLYGLIDGLPVIDGALPTRYALALIPLLALLLTQALDAAWRAGGFARAGITVAVAGALLPIAPLPLETTNRAPVPEFIASGAWRQCVPPGGVLVPVPLPTPRQPDAMRWAAAADVAFALPEGFFIGPYGPGGRSSVGTWPRPTSQFLAEVAKTGEPRPVTAEHREQARADLGYWRADCVALAPGPAEEALHETLTALLGPGTRVADTWTWRVTPP
jgi:hypothetical protein